MGVGPVTPRERLILPVAAILTLVWAAAGTAAIVTGNPEALVVVTPPFGLLLFVEAWISLSEYRVPAAHWLMLTTLMIAGESSLCYDGQYFFDTDHSDGASGTLSNSISFAAGPIIGRIISSV